MPSKDPRVDAYIARDPEFASPILRHLRSAVHATFGFWKGKLILDARGRDGEATELEVREVLVWMTRCPTPH